MFSLAYHVLLGLQMSTNPLPHVSFVDGAYRSTWNISSIAWALYSPNGEMVSLHGIFLGRKTNNIYEYSAVIELLSEVVYLGIRVLVLKRDSQVIALQLKHYSIRNPHILRMYLHCRLLERNFDYITYQNIPRNLNTVTYTLENYVLDIHYIICKKRKP